MEMFINPSKIYIYQKHVDFRNAINGLSQIVENEIRLPLGSGDLFLFCNKSKDKIKILYWDKTKVVPFFKTNFQIFFIRIL